MGGGAGRGADAPFAGGRISEAPSAEFPSAEFTVPETWGVAACGFGFVGGSKACARWLRTRAAVNSPNAISPHRASARRAEQEPRAPRNAMIPCVIAIRPNCSSYLPGRYCLAAVATLRRLWIVLGSSPSLTLNHVMRQGRLPGRKTDGIKSCIGQFFIAALRFRADLMCFISQHMLHFETAKCNRRVGTGDCTRSQLALESTETCRSPVD